MQTLSSDHEVIYCASFREREGRKKKVNWFNMLIARHPGRKAGEKGY